MATEDNIKKLWQHFAQQVSSSSLNEEQLLKIKNDFVGKNGSLTAILKSLKNIDSKERQKIGPVANWAKGKIFHLFEEKLAQIEVDKMNAKLEEEVIDTGLVREKIVDSYFVGGLHPRTIVQREVEKIFSSMGFATLDGPHIEDEFHNFTALNIPPHHPARDMQDTFWLKDSEKLLRTHTSTVQVRGMLSRKPPFRFIAPGMVFRSERTDASHETAFAQIEGMLVDREVSLANLIYFAKTLLKEIFNKEIKVRIRPGYFPFVEPGLEFDISCLICKGKGCPVCKYQGWVEILPGGMIHPAVLRHGGIDPTKWRGFAFGLGLDRLVMMKYGIDDIRHLAKGDLRFHQQFSAY